MNSKIKFKIKKAKDKVTQGIGFIVVITVLFVCAVKAKRNEKILKKFNL